MVFRKAILLLSLALSIPVSVMLSIMFQTEMPAISQTVQARKAEADRLIHQGNQQFDASKFRETLQSFEQALKIYRDIHDRQGEGWTPSNLGIPYLHLGNYAKAIEYTQPYLEIARPIKDRQSESLALNNIDVTFCYVPCSVLYASAQAVLDQKQQVAQILLNGIELQKKGKFREAIETFQQALQITRNIQAKSLEASALHNIGLNYYFQSKNEQALQYLQQSLDILSVLVSKEDLQKRSVTLHYIGKVYSATHRYSEALESFRQSLMITNKLEDNTGNILNLLEIGAASRSLDKYKEALGYYQQALAFLPNLKTEENLEARLVVLYNIGELQDILGQYSEALDTLQKSLQMADDLNYNVTRVLSRWKIGAIYRKLGQRKEAMKILQEALATYKKAKELNNGEIEAKVLNEIGLIHSELKQYKEALFYFQRVRKIDESIGKASYSPLNNIGTTYLKMAMDVEKIAVYVEYAQRALNLFEQALTLAQKENDRRSEATFLTNIASAHRLLGEIDQAFEAFQKGLKIHEEVENYEDIGSTLQGMSLLFRKNPEKAEKFLFKTLDIWEKLRTDLNDNNRVSQFETQAFTYKLLQEALIAQNKLESALEVAERGRARALITLLTSRLSNNTTKAVNPTIAQIKQIAQIQKATLIYYSFVANAQGPEEDLYIWVISPNGKLDVRKADLNILWQRQNTSLVNLVQMSREALGVRSRASAIASIPKISPAQQTQSLQTLHKLMIEPIADLLPKNENDRVIFIPQGELFLVPFPALQDKDGKFLIEKHTILTAPSIQVLDLTRKQAEAQKSRGSKQQTALVVGNRRSRSFWTKNNAKEFVSKIST